MTRWAHRLVVPAALLATSGCAQSPPADTLTVYAAASLAPSFAVLADEFEAAHDGVAVRLSTGGSSDLATQIDQGAPADVFAAADRRVMADLRSHGLVDRPAVFATNTLRVAVPPDNPAGITSFADLADPDVALVTCAPAVPCGSAAQRLAKRVGVPLRPVSEEQSVTDVLNKVRTGEADAGLVYVTDVTAAEGAVAQVPVPEAAEVVNRYPVATVTETGRPGLAAQFVELLLSERGREVLREHGFGAPR